MVCRWQDARAFIGAVFDDMGTGMALAGLAWDRAEDCLEHVAPGSRARTLGHCGNAKGTQLSEQVRQRPGILEALRHLSARRPCSASRAQPEPRGRWTC
eukprot:4431963-Pyramimonas_sp.AAC.1